MEAAVMDREAEMTEWNDGRLDELSKRVDHGFAQMREEFTSVNKRIDHLGTRFDALQRILMQVGGGIFVALIGLIATQV
jgi:tetrahydromethanopterin S-methyltransferase subunit G